MSALIPSIIRHFTALWLCAATAAAGLTLTTPADYQVIQRSSRSKGTMSIKGEGAGALEAGATFSYRLVGAGEGNAWRPLPVEMAGGTFTAVVTAPAGGWWRLEVQATSGGRSVGEAAVAHVGIGEVFVVAGQSNSANHGEERQRTHTGLVSSCDGARWQVAHDPQPGASGDGGSFLPPFGDALAERWGVPIGIVSCGVGATSVREWLPRGSRFPHPPTLVGGVREVPEGGWESLGAIYDAFLARMARLGPHGFRAVLWHQGESDANQTDPTRTLPGALYREYLGKLIADSRRDLGWEAPWFVARASYHVPGDEASPEIREAQATVWRDGLALEGPDTDALKGAMREAGGQGVHFSGPGLREHAGLWVDKVAPWVEARLAAPAGPRTLLFLGNSITLHGPAPDIGWTGNWGMAATSQDRDYVHVLTSRLAAVGPRPEIRVKNIADFERGYGDFDIETRLADELAFGAEIIVLAIGENVADPATEDARAAFSDACVRLLSALGRGGQARVFVRGSFWPHPVKDGILREAAARTGAAFVDISALGRDERHAARSERTIEHAGVAAHPGDLGMQAIAEALYAAMEQPRQSDWPDRLIGYSELRTNLPGGRHANTRTMRAFVVRGDGAGRREVAADLAVDPDTSTQFAGWSPDGALAIVHQAWKNAETARWEEEHQAFRFTLDGCRLDAILVDLASGSRQNITAVERVSFYNSGVFFWPGDSAKLGFTALIDGASHPFRMDRDGRNKTDLTRDTKAFSYGFESAPDGRHIAYHQDYQLVIADADGANARRIETGQPFNFGPRWSPDGEWLLFVSGEHYNCHPHIVRADGTGLRRLADRNGYRGVVDFLDVPDFHGGSSDTPVWSADGSRVFFTARDGEEVALWSVDLQGTLERLTRSGGGTEAYHPNPSPDGRWLVFGAKRQGVRQLMVLRLADRAEKQLTQLPAGHAAMWPHWQPAPGER
jgi:Tol biopolymer transport system component